MPTLKQKKAIQKTVENGGNVTKAMRAAGYSEATSNNPANLTRSKGFRAILEASGLTEGLIASALVEDIKNKPQNRAKELSLASDILGLRKHETAVFQSNTSQSLYINPIQLLQNPEYMESLKAYEDELKKILVQKP